MPVFICRWPNGNFSFAFARSKLEAVHALDEIGNAEGYPVRMAKEFMVHFRLTDDGHFKLKEFGERTEDEISKEYPLLEQAASQLYDEDPYFELASDFRTTEQRHRLRDAVQAERERVKRKPVKPPQTLRGEEIAPYIDAPSTLIDQIVRQVAEEEREKAESKKKPN